MIKLETHLNLKVTKIWKNQTQQLDTSSKLRIKTLVQGMKYFQN